MKFQKVLKGGESIVGVTGQVSDSWDVVVILPHIGLSRTSWHWSYVDINDINDILSISWAPVGEGSTFQDLAAPRT